MTKVRKPLFSLEAKGKLGPVVITRLKDPLGKVSVKRPPANPRSPDQLLIRDYYGSGVETYRTLDETEHLYYHNLYPRQRGHRAYLNFMKEWLMAKLPLHWLDHILGGRDEIANPLAEAAHPTTVSSLPYAHVGPPPQLPPPTHLIFPYLTCTAAVLTTTAISANRIHGLLANIPVKLTTSSLLIYVSAAAAGAKVRLGLYSADSNFQPSALLKDFGELDITPTGALTLPGIITLNPGPLYIAFLANSTPDIYRYNTLWIPTLAMPAIAQYRTGYYATQAYGALPTAFPTPTTINGPAWVIAITVGSLP